jgi:hypothetical protein
MYSAYGYAALAALAVAVMSYVHTSGGGDDNQYWNISRDEKTGWITMDPKSGTHE